MAATPIRHLVLMLDTIRQRLDVLEDAEREGKLTEAEWAPASRIWTRQHDALSCAIIAEPPQTFDDVLAVLTQLAERHDEIVGDAEHATTDELRDLHEMTIVAVKNCTLRLAALFRPDDEPTEAQHQALATMSKQAAHWQPSMEGK